MLTEHEIFDALREAVFREFGDTLYEVNNLARQTSNTNIVGFVARAELKKIGDLSAAEILIVDPPIPDQHQPADTLIITIFYSNGDQKTGYISKTDKDNLRVLVQRNFADAAQHDVLERSDITDQNFIDRDNMTKKICIPALTDFSQRNGININMVGANCVENGMFSWFDIVGKDLTIPNAQPVTLGRVEISQDFADISITLLRPEEPKRSTLSNFIQGFRNPQNPVLGEFSLSLSDGGTAARHSFRNLLDHIDLNPLKNGP